MLLVTILTFLFSSSFVPSVHAQDFQPIPSTSTCFASIEGQGLYIVGGRSESAASLTQAFVLSLSVSWSTSNPAIHQLKDSPDGSYLTSCTMFNDGKGLFAMASGMGFTYNLTSDNWIEVSNSNFASMRSTTATSDLESGIIYVPNNFPDFSGMRVMYSFDMNTKKYNTITMYSDTGAVQTSPIAWSAFLQSILFLPSDDPILRTFTPSKAGTPSGGWNSLNTTGENDWIDIPTCFVSAYGGSKMALFSGKDTQSAVYILDVATLVWRKGPSIPKLTFAACAVSGDQFILWSGHTTNSTGQHEISNRTLLYSMKTETWVSDYTPPPPTVRTPARDPAWGSDDMSSQDKKVHGIIIIIIGVLLPVSATVISVCIGVTKQPKTTNRGGGGDGIPPNSHEEQKWYKSGPFRWLSQRSPGKQQPTKHPHAIVVDPAGKRNVQEGAVEVEQPLQHPHTTEIEGDKAELDGYCHT